MPQKKMGAPTGLLSYVGVTIFVFTSRYPSDPKYNDLSYINILYNRIPGSMFRDRVLSLNIETVCILIFNLNVYYISGWSSDPKYKNWLHINILYNRSIMFRERAMTLNIITVCILIFNLNVHYISGQISDPKYKNRLYINIQYNRILCFGKELWP